MLDPVQFFTAWSRLSPDKLSSLVCIDLADTGLDREAASILGKFLRENTSVRTLSVYGNLMGVEGISQILEPLLDGSNQTLTALDIGHCGLDESAASLLGQLVANNSKLTHLCIRGNAIGDEGITSLCESIAEFNRTIQALDIGGIKFGTEGSKAVSSMLAQADSLQTFLMNYNYTLFAESMRIISEGLAKNKSLVNFDMSTTNSKAAGLVAVAEALKHHPAIKSLLVSSAHNANEQEGRSASEALSELLKVNRSIEIFECFSNGTRAGARPRSMLLFNL